jgi:hypothetical protein
LSTFGNLFTIHAELGVSATAGNASIEHAVNQDVALFLSARDRHLSL